MKTLLLALLFTLGAGTVAAVPTITLTSTDPAPSLCDGDGLTDPIPVQPEQDPSAPAIPVADAIAPASIVSALKDGDDDDDDGDDDDGDDDDGDDDDGDDDDGDDDDGDDDDGDDDDGDDDDGDDDDDDTAGSTGATLSTRVLDFGVIGLGEHSELEIVIANTGTTDMEITAVSVSGVDAVDFRPDKDDFTVKAGRQRAMGVRFRPESAGTKTATLTFATNTDEDLTVELKGVVIEPVVKFSDNPVEFGRVHTDRVETKKFRITNISEVTAGFESIEINDPSGIFFLEDVPPMPLELAPGEDVEITIACAATTTGTFTAMVDMLAEWMEEPLSVPVTCNARPEDDEPEEPAVVISLADVNFGVLALHSQSDTTLSLVNNSAVAITVEYVSLKNGAAFAVPEHTSEVVVEPSGAYALPVSFRPAEQIVYTDTLVVEIAELDLPIEVVLTGMGTVSTSVGDERDVAGVVVSPNPFSHSATIRTAGVSNVAYADVVDAMGTRVRSFAAGTFSSTGSVSWDGRSDSGTTCADGMYFVRINTGSGVVSVPVVLKR